MHFNTLLLVVILLNSFLVYRELVFVISWINKHLYLNYIRFILICSLKLKRYLLPLKEKFNFKILTLLLGTELQFSLFCFQRVIFSTQL